MTVIEQRSERDQVAFPELSETQIAIIAGFAGKRTFAAGETLFAAGESDFKFYVIISGEVEIIDDSSCEYKTVVVHQPGEFTGDIDMLTGRPAVVSAIARTDCEVYEMSAVDLRKLLGEVPFIGDVLLRGFLMRRQLLLESGFVGVRVVGSRYCKDTHRIREFLSRNFVPFKWLDLENDPHVNELLEHFNVSVDDTPVVVCPDCSMFKNPSNVALAECLGIRRAVSQEVFDLVIVGAGPAGLAAAVYGASDGLRTLLVDSLGPGGQAGTSSKIENYVGFPDGLSGSDLAQRALIQAQKFGAVLSMPTEVSSLVCDNGCHKLNLSDGAEVQAKSILISTGARYKKLGVEGCERFESSGVYYAATVVEAQMCSGSQVVVVGGGNSAGQAAVFLSGSTRKVIVAIRGDDLGKSMSEYLVRRIEQSPNIEVRYRTEVSGVNGDWWLETVDLTNIETGERETVECPGLFVFIGAIPHTGWLDGSVALDKRGFVLTGGLANDSGKWHLPRRPFLLETTRPGILAAGDVRLGSVKRVASAVGEGAMAVQFVHEVLKSA